MYRQADVSRLHNEMKLKPNSSNSFKIGLKQF